MRLYALVLLLIIGCGGWRCAGSDMPVRLPQPGSNGIFTPEPPPTPSSSGLRIATLNAAFLFDGVGDEGQATFPHKDDPELAQAHLQRVGAVIRMLDADVVMLQEVENEDVLHLLLQGPLAGAGYTPYFVQGTDTFTGQDIGLLARVPVDDVSRTDERVPVKGTDDTYGVSKNLIARLNLGNIPVTLIGLHFLAQPDNKERKPRREAQAEVIRRVVASEIAAGRAVAVLGDFNDHDEDTPDVAGNRPITNVLAIIKRAGVGASDDLRNVMASVPQEERFTHFWDRNDNGIVEEGELSAIDHILLSPELHSRVVDVDYVHAHDPMTYTDHFPILVTLDVD